MSKLRRYYEKGHTYFVTYVTYKRRSFLLNHEDILWSSIAYAQSLMPFDLIGWVIMPEHFHFVVVPQENDLSEIMRRIKMKFAGVYRSEQGVKCGRIWQHRFWDHIIRDETDLNRHLDYIHYNPTKHKIAASPGEYRFSSFRDYVENGYYEPDWGQREPDWNDTWFGE